jgi:hypothetical protein
MSSYCRPTTRAAPMNDSPQGGVLEDAQRRKGHLPETRVARATFTTEIAAIKA